MADDNDTKKGSIMQLIFFITGLDENGGAGPVLSIAGTPAPGALLEVASNQSQPVQLWQLTSSGTLVSAYSSNLVLGIGANNALIVDTPQSGNLGQCWTFSGGANDLGPIINQQTGQVLTVYTASNPVGSAVVLEPSAKTQAQQWTAMGFGCNSLLTTVTNTTPNNLTLTANAIEGTTNLSGSLPLPPNTSVTVFSTYNGGLATGFGVWDPNYSTTNSVASFVVHQHRCYLSAGDVWIDPANWVDGYTLSFQTTEGSASQSLPGNVSVSVMR